VAAASTGNQSLFRLFIRVSFGIERDGGDVRPEKLRNPYVELTIL